MQFQSTFRALEHDQTASRMMMCWWSSSTLQTEADSKQKQGTRAILAPYLNALLMPQNSCHSFPEKWTGRIWLQQLCYLMTCSTTTRFQRAGPFHSCTPLSTTTCHVTGEHHFRSCFLRASLRALMKVLQKSTVELKARPHSDRGVFLWTSPHGN